MSERCEECLMIFSNQCATCLKREHNNELAVLREKLKIANVLLETLKIAKEALEFYGDRNNWALREDSSNMRSEIDSNDLQEFRPNRKAEYCGGALARKALASFPKEFT